MRPMIRLMTLSDISAADSLRSAAGWNQTESDWIRLLTYQPDGCFVAVHNECVIGTVTTTCYGKRLAWIGMMLVSADHRNQGIGRSLLEHALSFLRNSHVDCVKLDATPLGKPLYERLGFIAEWQFHRWRRAADQAALTEELDSNGQLQDAPGTPVLLDQQRQRDRIAFGVNRSGLLNLLAAESTVISEEHGYALSRPGSRASYLGPVIAESPAIASRLCRRIVANCSDPMFWDVPEINPAAQSLAETFGFCRDRPLWRMRLGEQGPQVDTSLQYAIAGPATG